MYNQKVGKFGEDLAKDFLKKRGYEIIGANLKLGYNEIDIIARKKKTMVFVEVKTRVSQFYGPAEEAYVFTKAERFRKSLEKFIGQEEIDDENIRADLITVDINKINKSAKIKHYQDIL